MVTGRSVHPPNRSNMTGWKYRNSKYLLCQYFAANDRDEGFAMKLQGTGPWAATTVASILHHPTRLLVPLFLVMATLSQSASSQAIQAAPVANRAPLTAEQVMRNLTQMNRHRLE